MKKLIVTLVSVFVLAGCGSESSQPMDNPRSDNSVNTVNEESCSESRLCYEVIEVDGKRLECIRNEVYKKGGLSCNWEKYNKQ